MDRQASRQTPWNVRTITSLVAAALAAPLGWAAVTAEEAAKLKTELTPFGAERAGSKDGTIPAWNGGFTTPIPGDKPGGRRGDPFKDEKPLFSITAANMEPYADRLTDGTKAMLKRYPKTFRVDVYKTHRTAAAPQWVYDNTFKNATRAKMDGDTPKGAYGGIPFPMPKTGVEVIWNHLLRWRGSAFNFDSTQYQLTPEGKAILTSDLVAERQMPYYFQEGNVEQFEKGDGVYLLLRILNVGPPIRAGEAVVDRTTIDQSKTQAWVYLTGQRRVRKLPNACCDTPTPSTAGVMNIDELETFTGRTDRFDWKLLGKREMIVPYNGNRLMQAKTDAEAMSGNFLNPDHVRWETHRVWVVEATLRAGQRHVAPRSIYYCDEDSWICVLGDRWDGNGQLWRTVWAQTLVAPDFPGLMLNTFGFYDLLSGAGFVAGLYNGKADQHPIKPRFSDTNFTPEALTAGSAR